VLDLVIAACHIFQNNSQRMAALAGNIIKEASAKQHVNGLMVRDAPITL